MAQVGIVGYPNVGKTTLFNALTGLEAPTAPHPFATTEPAVGVARVPDERLERLAAMEASAKVTPATLELLDMPAMAREASGLAARYLGKLREMEVLAVVLRAFASESVPDAESGIDPVEQAESLLIELAAADAEVLERRSERALKEATGNASLRLAAQTFARAAAVVSDAGALRSAPWTTEERGLFRDLGPLTLKPTIWVVNEAEDATADAAAVADAVPDGDVVVTLSAAIEEEASRLAPEDRREMLEGLDLGEGALARMVGAAYSAMGVLTFYTTGPKETRAWTVRSGAHAPEAAGKIHSDLERGFIRVEVAGIDDLLGLGGWDAAKAAGSVRLEGKDYRVAEGDVLLVRFSV